VIPAAGGEHPPPVLKSIGTDWRQGRPPVLTAFLQQARDNGMSPGLDRVLPMTAG